MVKSRKKFLFPGVCTFFTILLDKNMEYLRVIFRTNQPKNVPKKRGIEEKGVPFQ